MVAVVAGHAIQRNAGGDRHALLFLAAFHTPLLAFVSGYLTMPPAAGIGRWLSARARRLLLPFAAWAPVLWFMSRFEFTGLDVVGIPESGGVYLGSLFSRPGDGLWYLLVLFYWAALAATERCLIERGRTAVIIGNCALVLGTYLLWRDHWFWTPDKYGLTYFAELLPFMVLGLLVRRFGWDLGGRLHRRAGLTGVVLLAVVAVWLTPGLVSHDAWPAVERFACGLVGMVGAVLLVRSVTPDRVLRPLAVIGRASLGVYAMHLLFLRTGIGGGWTRAVFSFVIALALSLAGTHLLRRSRLTAAVFLGESTAAAPA